MKSGRPDVDQPDRSAGVPTGEYRPGAWGEPSGLETGRHGCACPRAYYPVFRKLKAESGCVFNSIDRSDAAATVLHRHGHHTQREVIRFHAEGVPGYGPANPADESTHCRRNDGVAYPHKARLRVWQVGFDVDDDQVDDVKRAAAGLGWHVCQPYHSGSEFHHLNFARRPARWRPLFHVVFHRWPNRNRPKLQQMKHWR